ncbi:hypothetical protein GGTG_10682 [Gaeumannomyces tritici R3-111a-1]|uniref:Uncharacterized protein n=1 Tax=Gaeumannomyces tritici (strain R3-111a-1) TaxID=644352 RepID=J3PB08_GAET3|nr:hypothetical protein GGTG_10682 [Gaeumannomyces tritici R3-111a-1]EJT71424.1 hypothetical protein GGTG_10682 [Gaeumannomyces tritici R3-111a-1]
MKCQTFGAFFLAFALPTLAANLEQPAVETAQGPEVAVQEQSQDLERRIAPVIPILTTIFGGLLAGKGRGKRDLDLDAADHELERRIAPVIPILTTILPALFAAKGNGKRDLDGSNDAEAVLAELASAITAGAGSDAAHLERRFLPIFALINKFRGQRKRDLEGVDQADAEAALAELADMIEAQSDASLERRFFRSPINNILPLIPSIPSFLQSGGQKNARRSLDDEADAPLERRFLPIFTLLSKLRGQAKRDLDGSDAAGDAHLERRFLPIFSLLQKLRGQAKRDLEAPDAAALADLAAALTAGEGEGEAALQRRIAPAIPILTTLLGGLFASKGNGKRDVDVEADAAFAELAAALTAGEGEGEAALQRRIAPAIPILTTLLGGLFAGRGKGKRDVDGADADAALAAELASLIEADPSLLGRRDDEAAAAAAEEQTTSSHLSSADLAEVMAPVLEQAVAGEVDKRDESVARMRVARGIVV